jgi:hypothetical protein
MKKRVPKFKNEDDERRFWASADSTEYVDCQSGERKKLIRLKPSVRTISLRWPTAMIHDLKILANRRDCPVSVPAEGFLGRARGEGTPASVRPPLTAN